MPPFHYGSHYSNAGIVSSCFTRAVGRGGWRGRRFHRHAACPSASSACLPSPWACLPTIHVFCACPPQGQPSPPTQCLVPGCLIHGPSIVVALLACLNRVAGLPEMLPFAGPLLPAAPGAIHQAGPGAAGECGLQPPCGFDGARPWIVVVCARLLQQPRATLAGCNHVAMLTCCGDVVPTLPPCIAGRPL